MRSVFRRLLGVALAVSVVSAGAVVGVADRTVVQATGSCAASSSLSGSGTQGAPFLIGSAGDLLHLATTSALWNQNHHFKQTANINLNGCAWTPIGGSSTKFTGTYDGAGFNVTNLTVDNPIESHQGFFGWASHATLKNITLIDAHVTGSAQVGGLVGQTNGVAMHIMNSSVSGTVTGVGGDGSNPTQVGGLIGRNQGNVTGSHSSAVVSGAFNDVGGLIGSHQQESMQPREVTKSSATGAVTGSANIVGGLIGSSNTTVSASFASGAVNGVKEVGGLIGLVQFAANVTDSYATGPVSGSENVGGLVGLSGFAGMTVTRSYAIGSVSATTAPGGLVGATTSGFAPTVASSFWDASTTGQATSAGGDGKSTADMTSIATYGTWKILDGRSDFDPASAVWGICAALNDGYPFLLWQHPPEANDTVCLATGWTPAPNQQDPSSVPPPPVSVSSVPSSTVAPVSSVPAPVPDGGVLPSLLPGVSQVLVDGVPESVEVFVEASTDLVVRGQDFELRLAGECSAGCTIETSADGRQVLTLEERGLANVSGEGFLAGTPVYVWLFSEPRFLGELTVLADGTFAGSVALGDIAPGEHTLQVNGTSFDGKARTANLGVLVNASGAPTPGPGVLPATGSDAGVLWWVLMLVVLGVGLVAAGRRRPVARTNN